MEMERCSNCGSKHLTFEIRVEIGFEYDRFEIECLDCHKVYTRMDGDEYEYE